MYITITSCYKKILSVCFNLWQLCSFQSFLKGLRKRNCTHKKKEVRMQLFSNDIKKKNNRKLLNHQYSFLVPVGANHEKVKTGFQFVLRINSVWGSLKSLGAMCNFGQAWEDFLAQRNFLVSKFISQNRKW